MEAPNSAFTVKFNDAVSLGRDVKPAMTKTAAQTLLTTLCSKGFLHKSRESNFSLGVRALHELEAYLAQEFEEIVNEHQCASCDEFVSVVRVVALPFRRRPQRTNSACSLTSIGRFVSALGLRMQDASPLLSPTSKDQREVSFVQAVRCPKRDLAFLLSPD